MEGSQLSTTRRVDQSKRSPADILERQPPCDIEAELGVLGSMMLKPDVCDEIAPILRETDFYDPAHQRLFSHMLEMHTSGKRLT